MEFIAQYLVSSNNQKQEIGCDAFLKLLTKIRFNLDLANMLLPTMHEDYRYKTGINLLYRTIIDDIINSYYLWGTVVVNDPMQHALMNELNILHKEFVLGSIVGIRSEQEFRRSLDPLNKKTSVSEINVEEEFKKANPELVNQDGRWKNNSDIRASTHPSILKQFNQKDNSTFISEAKKLEFLKSRDVIWYSQLKSIFKYLSQYQHFSPRAYDLLNSHIDQDITMYQHSLGQLMMLLHELFAVLELKDKIQLKSQLKSLGESMMTSFNAEPF